MASRITIKHNNTTGFFSVHAPGGVRKSRLGRSAAIKHALTLAEKEVSAGFSDVEIHDYDGDKYYPDSKGKFMLSTLTSRAKTPKSERRKTGSKKAVLNVIFSFFTREQQHADFPITKAFAESDANLLLHLLKTMRPNERADLFKISIAQHGPGPTVPWLVGASAPRQFFFGKEYRSRTPSAKRGFFERLFT